MSRPGHRSDDPAADPAGEGLDHDVVVVGSGFGGSVAALRLTEKGYDVLVYEAGRRFADAEHARTSWDLPRYLWAPRLGWYGVQRIHRLPHVLVLAGAGVGGGSLNYACTLYRPPAAFYRSGPWADVADWQSELAPHYDTAERMLGVTTSTFDGPVEQAMRRTAEDMGVGDTFRRVPVGVFLPTPTVPAGRTGPDPYFDGRGPGRTACTGCGNCMVGCRVGAKNTLVKNYLHLAERSGARVEALRTVTRVEPVDPTETSRGWRVTTQRTGAPGLGGLRRDRRTVTCRDVVLAAGAWGTQSLLLRLRAEGVLPRLPAALGTLTRTNSEALVGAVADRVPDVDLTRGLAITSSFHPDADTHVENCRYGAGSDAMGLLATLLVDGGGRSRPLGFATQALRHPLVWLRSLAVRGWSRRAVIGLVMQSRDNSLTTSWRRGRLWGGRLTSRHGHGEPNPTWIPAGHDAIRRLAARLEQTTGVRTRAGGTVVDVLDIPMTAHFLGGCPIGRSAEDSVLDARQQVHGHPGLHVVDGAAVSANLGVNPALTITAQAERVFALWPSRRSPGVVTQRNQETPSGQHITRKVT
ncbi:FAD-dependent oxidoreductase [Aquipuribacter sp. MA13-6]|uniref:FAD-dependent oxidoreductase n=1 Tax=unclassified Aquipuribacter TaxID=2635084 RepID=UPI003EE9781E